METEPILKPPTSKALKSGRVKLAPGEEIGEHVTEKREEIIVVLNGTATIHKEDETVEIQMGKTYYIPEGIKHNVRNNSSEELEYLYVVSLF